MDIENQEENQILGWVDCLLTFAYFFRDITKNALLIIRENDIHFKGFQKILNFIFQLALYPMSSREIEKKEECADGMKELPYIWEPNIIIVIWIYFEV